MAGLLVAYFGSYATLRLTRYFVLQEFYCLSCSDTLMQQIKKDYPAASEITVASMRNQIGCGRIQKEGKRIGEAVLVPLFRPLGELEMVIRGHSQVRISAYNNVTDETGSEGGYTRTTLLKEYKVTRRDQRLSPTSPDGLPSQKTNECSVGQ